MSQTKPKDTILIVRNAAAGDFGGAETYPVSLAHIIQENTSYQPIIVSGSKKLLEYSKDRLLPVIKGWWLPFQNWSGKRALLLPIYVVWQVILIVWYIQLIIKTSAIALHLQSRDDFIAGTIAGRLLRRKVVWTDHMDLRYVFRNINKPFKNPSGRLVAWVSKYANSIIIISDNEYSLITKELGIKRTKRLKNILIIVKNGVPDQNFLPSQKAPKKNTFHFCIASRLVTNKGVGDAIEAFKLLTNQVTPLDASHLFLDIYGDGAQRQQFELQAKDRKNIHFHGYSANPTSDIKKSDVFILPSYQEGFSIALLEATMLGKAIIATDVDSNSEIIKHNTTGLLVETHRPTQLAAAMKRLYEDKYLRKSLEGAARKEYLKHYQLDKITLEQIVPLYR